MRTLALCLGLAFASAGCLGMVVPEHQAQGTGNDMAVSGPGDGTGSMNNNNATGDGGVGTLAFGEACAVDGDCQSGMCRTFAMGTVTRCTQACTFVSQTDPAPECPNPPSAGLCTNNGYCKFTQ
jgi:hypothetical protein